MTNEELDNARGEEAWRRFKAGKGPIIESASTIAARLAREGWTPPVVVDPDLEAVKKIRAGFYSHHPENPDDNETVEQVLMLLALMRGRELERAKAKPGLVWVKHDGSTICPVDRDIWVLTKTFGYNPCVDRGKRLAWQSVSFYAIITPPEDK